MNETPSLPAEERIDPLRSSAVQKALTLLLEGHTYAQDLQTSCWEFAVDVPTLLAAGSTENALRWLVCRNYVEFAVVPRRATSATRKRGTKQESAFPEEARFILTPQGAAVAR